MLLRFMAAKPIVRNIGETTKLKTTELKMLSPIEERKDATPLNRTIRTGPSPESYLTSVAVKSSNC